MRIVLLLILLIILNNMKGQQKPIFCGIKLPHSTLNKFTSISYDSGLYFLDESKQFSSATMIGNLLCDKIKKDDLREHELIKTYISLKIDPTAPIEVLDSIINELVAINYLKVFYEVDPTSSQGYFLLLNSENELVRKTLMVNNMYCPQKIDYLECRKVIDSKNNITSTRGVNSNVPMLPPPPPPPKPFMAYDPIDIMLRPNYNGIVNDKPIFIISKRGGSFYLNNELLENSIDEELQSIIKTTKYIFFVEMNPTNTYSDYISIIEKVHCNLNKVRESESDIDVNLKKKYPFTLSNYTIRDKTCKKLIKN